MPLKINMRAYLTALPRAYKKILVIVFDMACICLSLWLAMFLRFGHWQWKGPTNTWWVFAIAALLTSIPIFMYMGLYNAVLRYINSITVIKMIKACVLASVAMMLLVVILLPDYVLPRSVPFIYFLLLIISIVGSRYLIQSWLRGISLSSVIASLFYVDKNHHINHGKIALIYGSGAMLTDLITVLDATRDFHPVVIVDHANEVVGGELNGRPIYATDTIASVIKQFAIEEILLALPEATRVERKKVIAALELFNLPIRTMPSFSDLASGKMTLQDVQDVDIADVLGRPEVQPIAALMMQCITTKVVLVTGAGGSIGAELVRQVIQQQPKKIILLDHSEFNLYSIDRELAIAQEKNPLQVTVVSVLASVNDQVFLTHLMQTHQVDTVYHAAAYKHVPLVEDNIAQGVSNNVLGTVSCAQAAIIAGVERFVLISTDKAVRPTNVMGASKRLAEMALQALNQEKTLSLFNKDTNAESATASVIQRTCFTMVRFGNVLGSSGSVIPIFKEQIRMGGPITVTHPDITRYFMSIPEAAQLVIQAGAMGQGGDVFVLDMGEPVKIVDLAKRMVSLSGLTIKTNDSLEGDIDIQFTGLRPGEKLFEELLIGDNPEKTIHERIFKAQEAMLPWAQYSLLLHHLKEDITCNNTQAILQHLIKNVSGFYPS